MIPFIGNSQNSESRLDAAEDWSGSKGNKEEWAVAANGYKVSFGGDENVLKLIAVIGCTTL